MCGGPCVFMHLHPMPYMLVVEPLRKCFSRPKIPTPTVCFVLQITAEQILREARELQEQDFKAPKQKITDETELAEYRLRKRKEFEDLVRRVRWNSSVWVKVMPGPPLSPDQQLPVGHAQRPHKLLGAKPSRCAWLKMVKEGHTAVHSTVVWEGERRQGIYSCLC